VVAMAIEDNKDLKAKASNRAHKEKRKKFRTGINIDMDLYLSAKEQGIEFSKICEEAIRKNLSLPYKKDLLIKEIEFYQSIVDEKVAKYNSIIEMEKEIDHRLWEKALSGFQRNYEKNGTINYEAVNYWAGKLNVRVNELEKIIEKEIVD
jgi:post-segregation antitoxin (ccd killing protein)